MKKEVFRTRHPNSNIPFCSAAFRVSPVFVFDAASFFGGWGGSLVLTTIEADRRDRNQSSLPKTLPSAPMIKGFGRLA